MKKIVIGILSLCSFIGMAQEEKSSNWNVNLTVESNHVWRGLAIADRPSIDTQVSYNLISDGSLTAGFWSGLGISSENSGKGYREMDWFISYQKNGFSVALWDLYNATGFSYEKDQKGNYLDERAKVFNYDSETTGHIFDLRLGYNFGPSNPLTLEADFLLLGTADRAFVEDGNKMVAKQRVSTYVQASYDVQAGDVTVSPFIGAGFSLRGDNHLYGDGENNFDIVNVGFKASKKVTLGNWTVPVTATTFYNPSLKMGRMNLALGLF